MSSLRLPFLQSTRCTKSDAKLTYCSENDDTSEADGITAKNIDSKSNEDTTDIYEERSIDILENKGIA